MGANISNKACFYHFGVAIGIVKKQSFTVTGYNQQVQSTCCTYEHIKIKTVKILAIHRKAS